MRRGNGHQAFSGHLIVMTIVMSVAADARAHQVIELRGELVLSPDRVLMVIEPDAHALAVLGYTSGEFGLRRCAVFFSQSMQLHDRHGSRLRVDVEISGGKIELRSDPVGSSWPLSLRWAPRSHGRFVPGRVRLAWQVGDARGSSLLTSGGNVVCLDGAYAPPEKPIASEITIASGSSTSISVRLPATIVSELVAISADDAGRLSPGACRRLEEAAAEWFDRIMRIQTCETPVIAAHSTTELLIRGAARHPASSANACLTEVRWRGSFGPATPRHLSIEIPRELVALAPISARVIGTGGIVSEGLVTTADPLVTIDRRAGRESVTIGRSGPSRQASPAVPAN